MTVASWTTSACPDGCPYARAVQPPSSAAGVCSETTPAFQSWKLTNVTFTGTPSSRPNGGNATGYAIPTGPSPSAAPPGVPVGCAFRIADFIVRLERR